MLIDVPGAVPGAKVPPLWMVIVVGSIEPVPVSVPPLDTSTLVALLPVEVRSSVVPLSTLT